MDDSNFRFSVHTKELAVLQPDSQESIIYRILQQNSSPYILPVLRVDQGRVWVARCLYSLSDVIKQQFFTKNLDNGILKTIIYEILCGLKFLHQNGILHLDIKPSNHMFPFNDYRIVIIDFDNSAILSEKIFVKRVSELYKAPELHKQKHHTGLQPNVDTYALGIIVAEILKGSPPQNPNEARQIIENDTRISSGEKELYKSFLINEAPGRPSAAQVLNSDVFSEFRNDQKYAQACELRLKYFLETGVIETVENFERVEFLFPKLKEDVRTAIRDIKGLLVQAKQELINKLNGENISSEFKNQFENIFKRLQSNSRIRLRIGEKKELLKDSVSSSTIERSVRIEGDYDQATVVSQSDHRKLAVLVSSIFTKINQQNGKPKYIELFFALRNLLKELVLNVGLDPPIYQILRPVLSQGNNWLDLTGIQSLQAGRTMTISEVWTSTSKHSTTPPNQSEYKRRNVQQLDLIQQIFMQQFSSAQ